jgi:hypothetical protein
VKKRVKNVLKAMGSGLQRSHAGEMLTNEQKAKVLKSSSTGEMRADKEKANVSERHA